MPDRTPPAVATTRLLHADRAEDRETALELLRGGRLVAVPTETVYGLAGDASNPAAVRAIFAAKGRPTDHPLIVHLPAAERMRDWARDIPDAAWTLARAFWPGPLTLLLQRAPQAPAEVAGGRPTIGLRVPAHPMLLELLRAFDGGLAAPSANPYRRLSPTTAAQVLDGLNGRIDAVLDGGPCTVGLESTIVDLTGPVPRIVRAGPIGRAALEAALGVAVEHPERHDAAVPGNVAVHYQPHTPLHVLPTALLRSRLALMADDARVVVLHYSCNALPPTRGLIGAIKLPSTKADYARLLYRCLHDADALGARALWLERPPQGEEWRDVHDRLARAASPLPDEA